MLFLCILDTSTYNKVDYVNGLFYVNDSLDKCNVSFSGCFCVTCVFFLVSDYEKYDFSQKIWPHKTP